MPLAVAGLALAAVLWAAPAVPGLELSVRVVADLIRSWGAWGVAVSVLLMVVHSFVPFPAEVVAMANGMLYGPLWGTAVTWAGAMLGAWLAFGLARRLGRPWCRAWSPSGTIAPSSASPRTRAAACSCSAASCR